MPRVFEYRARVREVLTVTATAQARVSRSFTAVTTPTLVEVTSAARVSVSYTTPPQAPVVALGGAVTVARTFGYHADTALAFDLRARAGQAHTFTYTGTPGVITLDGHTQYVAALNLRQRWKDDNDLFGIEE